jgi:hypothetical protein
VVGLGLALALISASVALRVEDARGVSADDQAAILAAFSEAIAARSGRDAAVDRAACKKKDRCLAEVAQRVQAEDVVFLRMLGVPTRIRIIAEREAAKFSAKKTGEIDLPRTRDAWTPALASLAEALFEPKALPMVRETPPIEEKKEIALVAANPQTGQEDSLRRYAPWIAIGAGAAAFAVGSVFGLSSRGARADALEPIERDETEFRDLEDRAQGHGLAANILFGAAVVGVGTGVVLLVIE